MKTEPPSEPTRTSSAWPSARRCHWLEGRWAAAAGAFTDSIPTGRDRSPTGLTVGLARPVAAEGEHDPGSPGSGGGVLEAEGRGRLNFLSAELAVQDGAALEVPEEVEMAVLGAGPDADVGDRQAGEVLPELPNLQDRGVRVVRGAPLGVGRPPDQRGVVVHEEGEAPRGGVMVTGSPSWRARRRLRAASGAQAKHAGPPRTGAFGGIPSPELPFTPETRPRYLLRGPGTRGRVR